MNKICRICLEEGVFSSIFTKNFNISLCDMIEYCCNVKISSNDGLPEQMCGNCIYKLGIAYHFKQTCESADVRLRQYLGLRVPEKSSDAAVMTDPIVTPVVVKKCKCKLGEQKKSRSNYKRKPDLEKLKRGPKPKPKQTHSCYQCAKQFRCQAQLEMHERTHTGVKPFACAYCPRRFTQKHNLTIHLRLHSGDKPFQCEVCSKRFSAQGNLYAHLKIHTGQKDHVCSICNKSFITSSEVTRHMNKHRGNGKNFKCDLCGVSYVHARDLKLHKMKKHQILPPLNTKVQSESFNNSSNNEGFNNSSNIDIIGIDVTKEIVVPMPVKNTHNIMHLVDEKPQDVTSLTHGHSLLSYEHKEMKDLYHHHQYPSKTVNEGQTCTICGEVFDFLTGLAHHYLHRHKGYDQGLNLT